MSKPNSVRTMTGELNIYEVLDSLGMEMRNTNRRLDEVINNQESQRKSIDILNGDREILESIITYQRELKSIVQFAKEHQQKDNKEVQLSIGEVKNAIDNTIPQVQTAVLNNLDQAIEVIQNKKKLDFKKKGGIVKKVWDKLIRRA